MMDFNISKQSVDYITNIIIVTILILIFIACIKISKKMIKNKFIKMVKCTSLRYKDILIINEKYNFHELENTYELEKYHKSKAQFDRFSYTNFLEGQIEKNIDFFETLIEEAGENAVWLQQYSIELEGVSPFADKNAVKGKGMPYYIYKRIEKKIINDIILEPIYEPMILCVSRYISPKGRNSYYDASVFSYEEWIERFRIVCERIEKRETKEYQRKCMTSSLRYDIMKRDKFRCVLCGRSAEDGVKLHVDHIIPVSKGGKTTPENLRTLCDTCNLGKGDKYDEYGEN